jgi:hypothetical protein
MFAAHRGPGGRYAHDPKVYVSGNMMMYVE